MELSPHAAPSSTYRSQAQLQHPVTGSAVAEVTSLHRGDGEGGTWIPRGTFPYDSWGNSQPQHPCEEQQPVWAVLPLLLCAPSHRPQAG